MNTDDDANVSREPAALRLYGLPMGNILRCPRCASTLIRAVARDTECWLDLRGVAALHLRLA